MQLYTIDTGFFKLDGGAMFGVVPKAIWKKLNPADDNNLCSWAMRCLLIQEGDRLILVDTGIGNKQDEKFFGYYHLHGTATLEGSLAGHGFHPDDITDVLLTHLHFDHVGGAVSRQNGRLLPTFKNAVYWSNSSHWEWAVNPNEREKASFLKENFLQLQESGQLRFFNREENPLPGVSVRIVSGHTESMMLPMVSFKGHDIVYLADLVPSVAHLPIPYVMAYDMRPLTTLSEKKALLHEASDRGYVLFFEHDPQSECCVLEETPKGLRAKETFKLSDL